jgi:hypothetical protein
MHLSFLGFGRTRAPASSVVRHGVNGLSRFRPTVEGLEERAVMSHSPIAAPVAAPALLPAVQTDLAIPINIPATVTDLTFENGQLLATLEIAGQTLTDVPLDVTIDLTDGECPILNVEIPDGLHIDLLGLNIDTSGICLNITAESGEGNLLGNLLCGITGLLDDGGLLDDLLGTITGAISLNDLFDTIGTVGSALGLTQEQIDGLINGVLDAVIGVIQPALDAGLDSVLGTPTVSDVSVSGTSAGACDILNLDLGPIHLDLLGLVVDLDDCEGGPVEVDITAEPGSGKLLGNLLCGVSHLLDGNGNGIVALGAKLNKIGKVIDRLT